MKIKELRCDQFAGLTDKSIKLEDGLNIIVGPNESGKSTLIDLIYHIFFKDAVLDGRTDKTFKEIYFPKSTGKFQGDTIDGVLKFETADGVYKLSKEWSGKDGLCKLTMPDGTTIRDNATINEILSKELEYGRGIYDELIFDSQKRGHTVLQTVLNGEKTETASELSALLTKAVMETGGMDIDKMGSRLEAIIDEYNGHWDFDMDMPEGGRKRGINNPWKKGVGKVLSAYYEMETVKEAQKNAEEAERNVESINAKIREKKQSRQRLNDKRAEFARVRSVISELSNLKALVSSNERELSEMNTALAKWPAAVDGISKAKELQEKQKQARTYKLYNEVKLIADQLENNKKALASAASVEADDVAEAEKVQKTAEKLEAKLAGMNLTAKITPIDGAQVHITKLSDGQDITGSEDKYDITEAVSINVPGVIDIQLMPKGVDVDEIKSEISVKSNRLNELLGKYSAENVEQLKSLYENQKRLMQENDMFESQIAAKLGGLNWEDVKKAAPRTAPPLEEVEKEIKELCGLMPLDGFIGAEEEKVRAYTAKYESVHNLAELAAKKTDILEKDREKLLRASDIPEEFSQVADPDAYEKDLSARIDDADGEIERLREELSAAERNLGDKSAEEYSEEYLIKKADFEEKKATCKRWMHIYEVFTSLRSEMKGNPMADVEKYFSEYLAKLSGGNISVEGVEESLEAKIVSKNHPLTYQILSEGTKDTISLAFRLAVLDHLYPNGGGIAVFDDSFTDMDPARVKEACALIESFAERNQVLFITCDDKYCDFMNGNVISVS